MTHFVNKYAICTGLLTLGLVAPAAAQSEGWEPERLSDGQPSIMGMWNNSRAVFTPLEYGCCGLSEEDAIAQIGEMRLRG